MTPLRNRIFGPAALSFPTWAYVVFFFVIPVAMVIFFSFGYKPDIYTPVATDRLSFDRFPEAMNPAFVSTFFATLRISILGTILRSEERRVGKEWRCGLSGESLSEA